MQPRSFGRALGVSVLTLSLGTAAHAQCPSPDGFEPNNDCASAVVMTPGAYPGLTCQGPGSGADDPDFYRIDVPNGERVNAQIHHSYGPGEDLDLYLYDAADPNCGDRNNFLTQAYHAANNEAVSWTNTSGATMTVVLEVAAYANSEIPVACDEYDLLIDVGVDACSGITDDAEEDNDDCASARLLSAGYHTGLIVRDTDADYYQAVVQPNDRITVDAFYGIDGFDEDLELALFADAQCNTLVGTSGWEGSNSVSWSNATAAPVTISFTVYTLSFPGCNEYSVQISSAPDPCLLASDDVYEPNDSCLSAVTVANGNYPGLFVSKTDLDYYKITVQPLDRLIADISYLSTEGELEIELSLDNSCFNVVDSAGLFGDTTAEYGNNTGAPIDVYVAVRVWNNSDEDCNDYTLDFSTILDPCLQLPDDVLEPNDDCASATPLTPGPQYNLFWVQNDPDFYEVVVPNGEQLSATLQYSPVGGGLEIALLEDSFCVVTLDSASHSGNDVVTYTNLTGSAQTYRLRVDVPPFATTTCKNYDLDVVVAPDPCLNGADDAFEDNDDCASAVNLPTGMNAGLFVSGSDRDYYTIAVPAGDRLTIDASYDASTHPLLLTLHDDSTCTTLIDQQGWSGSESFSWSNSGISTANVTLAVETDSGAPSSCNTYSLDVATSPDPCLATPDDVYEENDNCFGPTPLVHGTLPNLFVSKADPDYFSFTLDAGQGIEIHAVHVAANGDIDMNLYDQPGVCGNVFASIAVAATALDDEVMFFTNNSGASATFYLQVEPRQNGSCNTYRLTALFDGTPVASPTCAGDGTFNAGGGPVACPCGNQSPLGSGEGCVNSQGHGAVLSASGSALFANDDLVFTVSQARPNQPSMLVQGSTLTALPFKDGVLCMGNPTERVEVVFVDGTGSGSTSGSIVTQGNVPGPGFTRYYQQWYRDPNLTVCGTGSNFSSGLRVAWL